MSILPAFIGALCVILGLAMLGNRAGYFYLVIRPRSLVTLAVIVVASGWFLTGAHAASIPVFIKACTAAAGTDYPTEGCFSISHNSQFLCTKNNGCSEVVAGLILPVNNVQDCPDGPLKKLRGFDPESEQFQQQVFKLPKHACITYSSNGKFKYMVTIYGIQRVVD
jgi:hypothetical protein